MGDYSLVIINSECLIISTPAVPGDARNRATDFPLVFEKQNLLIIVKLENRILI